MVDPIQDYLAALERDLRGRIPKPALTAVLDESASHLHDLEDELGSSRAAIAKYGSARRFARRVLRTLNPVPNAWRAAAIPFGLALLIDAFLMLAPISVLQGLAMTSVSLLSLSNLTVVGTLVFLWGCYRSRQLLLKPILAFAIVHCAMVVLYSNWKAIPVPVHGQVVRAISRDGGVSQFNRELDRELADLEHNRQLLATGNHEFGLAKGPETIPATLRFGNQGYANPRSITASLYPADGQGLGGFTWTPNLFMMSSSSTFGGIDQTFEEAKKSWARDYRAENDRVNFEMEKLYQIRLATPAALRQPWWTQLALSLPMAAKYSLRTGLVMFQLNLFAWLAWATISRITWPRRRFA